MLKKTMLSVSFAVMAALIGCNCGGGDSGKTTDKGTTGQTKSQPGKKIDMAKTGTVTVTVKYDGDVPAPDFFDSSGVAECNRVTEGKVPKELLVVNPNKTLANALVYVSKGWEGYEFDAPTGEVVLDQKGCRYHPHVVALRVNQKLKIENGDDFAHNVHALPEINKPEFNVQQGGKGQNTQTKTFKRPEIGLFIKCDVHSWMSCYAHVLEHPWFGLTGEEGTVKLSGLPAGKYTISVWHEKYKGSEQKVEVEVKENGDATADVSFKAM